MFVRWLTAAVVAIGLGVAALELSTCLAVEPHATVGGGAHGPVADGLGTDVPVVGEHEASEPSAMPRLTH
jgi:hypothetical protein